MHTIELTDAELRILHAALHSYLDDFGHDEADVLRAAKQLLAKLPSPGPQRQLLLRIVLWNIADSATTIGDLRRYLRDESVDLFEEVPGLRFKAWISDETSERWGAVYLWESREAAEQTIPSRARELIGKEPDLSEEFDVEATIEGDYIVEGLSRLGLAFEDQGPELYPRHRLDLTSRHLLVALRACANPPEADELERRVEGLVGPSALAFLSARSAWGLVLDALDLPAGSEVLFSALTHPEMARIAAERGFVPVPVDLDPVTLAPDEASLERAVTSRSRVLIVAHLFGGRIDLAVSAAFAERRGLILVEDCAQSLRGPDDTGDDRAAVSLFSFGAIKTATALGGALAHVRDPELRGRMWGLRSAWDRQEVSAYAVRVGRFGALHALENPGVFSAFVGTAARVGLDQDALLAKAVRSSPARRLRPSAPLLALLGHRLRHFDTGRLRRRAERGEQLADALPPTLSVPGRSALDHTHWVVPVASPSPEKLIAAVRAAGFDANTATTSVDVVSAPPGRPEPQQAAAVLDRIVFVPAYPELPEPAFERLLETVRLQ